jgi:hypothetical protein
MSSLSISVALCTYNGAPYLAPQLRSLAQQTRLPDELVISDDGSTDETPRIVEAFASEAPFPVRFLRQPANLGSTQNFAAAIAACGGDCIALCDQDDVWLPEKLAKGAKFFDEHRRCLAVFSDATVVDEALHPIGENSSLWSRVFLDEPVRRRLSDPSRSLETLAGRHVVTGATLMIRRELADCALPIPKDLPKKLIHDGWIALVAAALGGLDSIPEPTMLYRQHDKQQLGASGYAPPPSAFDREERFVLPAAGLTKVHALLAERVGPRAVPGVLEELGRRAAHLRHRAHLPASRWERVRRVWSELRRGNYQRYSQRPVLAAVRDVVY